MERIQAAKTCAKNKDRKLAPAWSRVHSGTLVVSLADLTY
jgi:hypothetical protein